MKKKYSVLLCLAAVTCLLVSGCAASKSQVAADPAETVPVSTQQTIQTVLEDGVYSVQFDTDSSMFHVSEACKGKGTLTVKDSSMTLHISLASKNIVNLFPGSAEAAQKAGAKILQPTIDTVTYSDGMTEEVNGFDVPVPVLEEEFNLAILGTKGKWYDHKVSVSNLEPAAKDLENIPINDGTYTIDVTLGGGTGRVKVFSPAILTVKDGTVVARIEWSSTNYDYMKIGNVTYDPVNTEGNSIFEIPVTVFDKEMEVTADTTAMSTPHEISYTLNFHSDSMRGK